MAIPVLLTVGALGVGWVALSRERVQQVAATPNGKNPGTVAGQPSAHVRHSGIAAAATGAASGVMQSVDQTTAGVPGGSQPVQGAAGGGAVLGGGVSGGSGNAIPGTGKDPTTTSGTNMGGDDPTTNPSTGTVVAPSSTPMGAATATAASAEVAIDPISSREIVYSVYGPSAGVSRTQESRVLGTVGPGQGLVW